MSSILRSIKRNKERSDLFKKYGKKPKNRCPKCGELSLFQRKNNKIICVKCKEVVK